MLNKAICKHCLRQYSRKSGEVWTDFDESFWEETKAIYCPSSLRRRQPVTNDPVGIDVVPSYCPFHLEHCLAES